VRGSESRKIEGIPNSRETVETFRKRIKDISRNWPI